MAIDPNFGFNLNKQIEQHQDQKDQPAALRNGHIILASGDINGRYVNLVATSEESKAFIDMLKGYISLKLTDSSTKGRALKLVDQKVNEYGGALKLSTALKILNTYKVSLDYSSEPPIADKESPAPGRRNAVRAKNNNAAAQPPKNEGLSPTSEDEKKNSPVVKRSQNHEPAEFRDLAGIRRVVKADRHERTNTFRMSRYRENIDTKNKNISALKEKIETTKATITELEQKIATGPKDRVSQLQDQLAFQQSHLTKMIELLPGLEEDANLKFDQKLGEGTFGVVKKEIVVDESHGKKLGRIAVEKLAKQLPGLSNDLRDDVNILLELLGPGVKHPHLLELIDVTDDLSTAHFGDAGMDLDGLAEKLGHNISPSLIVSIALQCADGLAFMHDKGIIHRDIKPPNVLIDASAQVRLGDMGLAVTERNTGGWAGTTAYFAPETFVDGSQTRAGDIYALGVTLLELDVGRPLWQQLHEERVAIVEEQIKQHQAVTTEGMSSLQESEHILRGTLLDTIEQSLKGDPKERITAPQMLRKIKQAADKVKTLGIDPPDYIGRWHNLAYSHYDAITRLIVNSGVAGESTEQLQAKIIDNLRTINDPKVSEQLVSLIGEIGDNSDWGGWEMDVKKFISLYAGHKSKE